PLWGVADTGPWLHDGRARTLKDAILFHESPGSEADEVIEAFKKLAPEYQQDVVDFLLTLKLPGPGI
ncbi:MAG: di-heme oxidoredictase family protein, partial [Blastocatellia bacterium]